MEIDIRCEDLMIGIRVTVRCQLLGGHEGRHVAVGRTVNAARETWTWARADGSAREVQRRPYDHIDVAGLPWAAGMPTTEFAVSD